MVLGGIEVLSSKEKSDILHRFMHEGDSIIDISKSFGITESDVGTILKQLNVSSELINRGYYRKTDMGDRMSANIESKSRAHKSSLTEDYTVNHYIVTKNKQEYASSKLATTAKNKYDSVDTLGSFSGFGDDIKSKALKILAAIIVLLLIVGIGAAVVIAITNGGTSMAGDVIGNLTDGFQAQAFDVDLGESFASNSENNSNIAYGADKNISDINDYKIDAFDMLDPTKVDLFNYMGYEYVGMRDQGKPVGGCIRTSQGTYTIGMFKGKDIKGCGIKGYEGEGNQFTKIGKYNGEMLSGYGIIRTPSGIMIAKCENGYMKKGYAYLRSWDGIEQIVKISTDIGEHAWIDASKYKTVAKNTDGVWKNTSSNKNITSFKKFKNLGDGKLTIDKYAITFDSNNGVTVVTKNETIYAGDDMIKYDNTLTNDKDSASLEYHYRGNSRGVINREVDGVRLTKQFEFGLWSKH